MTLLFINPKKNTENFQRIFKNVLKDMAKMPESVVVSDITENKGERVKSKALKDTIMRYHQPVEKQKLL